MRLRDRWPLTNRLPLTAHGRRRFFARCPRSRLLYMTNSGRFCWHGFGLFLTTDFRRIRLFVDRRRCALRHIVRKPYFRLLRVKIIPRRRFFCAGFLCLPHIRALPLLLRRGCRYALRLVWFWSSAQVIHALAWHIFCRWYGRCGMLCLLRCGWRCCCSILCSLLNIRASCLLLWCGRWCALRLLRF